MLVGVYGAGGCGRSIMPLVREQHGSVGRKLVFIDDGDHGDKVNGHEIWTWDQFVSTPADNRAAVLAVASSELRARLDEKCQSAGVKVFGVQAASAIVMDDVTMGHGAIVSPFVALTSNIRIGRCFHINLHSYVEHDCLIGDYVTFAPGVRCNGNTHIGDHVYIGAGAVIRQGTAGRPLKIGAGAVVGMGAVVTKDVPQGVTVVGNPARPLLPKD